MLKPFMYYDILWTSQGGLKINKISTRLIFRCETRSFGLRGLSCFKDFKSQTPIRVL
jgi:hypothetical protein